MSTINENVKETLKTSLFSYYGALERGSLNVLTNIMTTESYLMTLESLGFRRAFKESHFKELLKQMENNASVLKEVEIILSADLVKEAKEHPIIEVISFESKGSDRITLHYEEDTHPKKLYFSSSLGEWKIDYKAGRKKS
jgi:excinuclease UvrABC ATPase subunit